MIKKTENCLYCGEKMESKTAKKKFCCDLHRVYWNREKALIDIAKRAIAETPKDSEYKNYTAKVSDVVIMDIPKNEPKENTMAFYNKYDCMTYAEVKAKK